MITLTIKERTDEMVKSQGRKCYKLAAHINFQPNQLDGISGFHKDLLQTNLHKIDSHFMCMCICGYL